jgi:hypothetical protein
LFVHLRTALADRILDHGPALLLADNAPWWLLIHYPDVHDVFTGLDGALIMGWIVGTALILGGFITICLTLASLPARGIWRRACAPELRADAARRHRLVVGLRRSPSGSQKARACKCMRCRPCAGRYSALARCGACGSRTGSWEAGRRDLARDCAPAVFPRRREDSRRVVPVRLPRRLILDARTSCSFQSHRFIATT